MASCRSCGFHSSRWASAFSMCCADVLGQTPLTFVAPLAPDHADISKVAESEECASELRDLDSLVGDRSLILRVDRIELSKNLLRGFLAYEDLLRSYPQWRGRVIFAALVYPSREGLAEYQAYRQEVQTLAERINATWATPGWDPILLDTSDNFSRSVAALRRYDVLLVNPVRDGLNLVAKEGPLVNERAGLLVLSRESGAWGELSDCALGINPFDVAGTADALAEALTMEAGPRRERAAATRETAGRRTPRDWLDDQLRAAGMGESA